MSFWPEYYKNTKNKPPAALLVEAVGFVDRKDSALDLGAGALVSSKYLLSLGFRVVAVDKQESPEHIADTHFTFIQSDFRDYDFEPQSFDLVTAQFSLPFVGKADFDTVWQKVVSSLRSKGVFAGQFFGVRDQWNVENTKLTFHTKQEVETLLSGLHVLKLEEKETDGTLANGDPKHWHVFNIIAQKNI